MLGSLDTGRLRLRRGCRWWLRPTFQCGDALGERTNRAVDHLLYVVFAYAATVAAALGCVAVPMLVVVLRRSALVVVHCLPPDPVFLPP